MDLQVVTVEEILEVQGVMMKVMTMALGAARAMVNTRPLAEWTFVFGPASAVERMIRKELDVSYAKCTYVQLAFTDFI